MSTFGGAELIETLNEFNVPGTEKLKAEAIDWIFYDNNLQPVAKFFEWLSQSVSCEDLLTDEELLKYNELLEKGSLLPEEFLDDIKECIDSTVFCHSEKTLDPDVPDEKAIEKQLNRKNQLCLQKMELQEEINSQRRKNSYLEADIQETLSLLDSQADTHSKTVASLCTSLDEAVNNFANFRDQNIKIKTSYFSQLDLSQWQREENNCRTSMRTYINKQFKKNEKAALEDSSSYCLLDSGKIDVELAKSGNIAKYNRNVNELNRLSKAIELSEIRLIEAELEKTEFESHIYHMENMLKPAEFPYVDALAEEHSRLATEKAVIDVEYQEQLTETLNDAKAVAAFERCKTISGDYIAKIQRQQSYFKKQYFITESLLEQLSRYDFIRICLETEKKELSHMLKLVGDLNTFFVNKSKQSRERQEQLKHEETTSNTEYEKIFENLNGQANLKDSCHMLNEKLIETTLRKKSCLDQMESLCSSFEKCLLTEGKSSMTSLPSSWLHPDLIDKSEKLENDLWTFQQEMFGVINAIETKKKIIAVNPEIAEEMLEWTKNQA